VNEFFKTTDLLDLTNLIPTINLPSSLTHHIPQTQSLKTGKVEPLALRLHLEDISKIIFYNNNKNRDIVERLKGEPHCGGSTSLFWFRQEQSFQISSFKHIFQRRSTIDNFCRDDRHGQNVRSITKSHSGDKFQPQNVDIFLLQQ
jgi:hypothetical protein